MKSLYLFLAALVITFQSTGQMVLTDGTSFHFTKIKSKGDVWEITKSTKEKISVEPASIKCFKDKETEVIRYYIPVSYESTGVSSGEFHFLGKRLEGKINLYERVTAPSNAAPLTNSSYTRELFIQKGSVNRYLFSNAWLAGNKERLVLFKEFIGDNAELLREVESEDFKFKYDDVIDIVNRYNVDAFKSECTATSKQGSVSFYSRLKGSTDQVLTLTVNDTIQHVIPVKAFLSIKLCSEGFSKVCVSDGTIKTCSILSGSPPFAKYVEVEFNGEKKKIQLEEKTPYESHKYLQDARLRK